MSKYRVKGYLTMPQEVDVESLKANLQAFVASHSDIAFHRFEIGRDEEKVHWVLDFGLDFDKLLTRKQALDFIQSNTLGAVTGWVKAHRNDNTSSDFEILEWSF